MKVALHVVEARRARLGELLRERQYLPLAEICRTLGISEPTARRDLAALARESGVTRTHGGAFYEYDRRFPSFRERLRHVADSKRRIAAAAAGLVRAGETLWLDGGTTGYAIAQAIAARAPRDLTVVTNNLPAAERLADGESVAVHLLGGQYFRRSSLLVGGHAVRALRGWRFDVAFLGAEGLTAEGLWNSVAEVVALQKAVVAAARRVVWCLDASKVGRGAHEFLLPLARVERVLTDAPAGALARAGIKLPARALLAA